MTRTLLLLALTLLAAQPIAAQSLADSVRQGRDIRASSLASSDLNAMARTLSFHARAGVGDRVLSLLGLEQVARSVGSAGLADTVFQVACASLGCGLITDDPSALADALGEEARLRGGGVGGRSPLQKAVRLLMADAALPWLGIPYRIALSLPPDARGAVAAAGDSAVAGGRGDIAMALLYAEAYTTLPTKQVIGGGGGAANAALTAGQNLLRRAAPTPDSTLRARATSLVAMAHLRLGHLDSARVYQASAESMGVRAPREIRALLRRRSAVVAAHRGDTAGARLLLEGVRALRGPGNEIVLAWDRYHVGRAFLEANIPTAAIAYLRSAHETTDRLPAFETAATMAGALGEAHRISGAPDSAIFYFRRAAEGYAAIAMDDRTAQLLAAVAEEELERGAFVAAEKALGEAEAVLTRWPYDGTAAAARLMNDRGLLLYARAKFAEAEEMFVRASERSPSMHSEFTEAHRNRALAGAARAGAAVTGEMLSDLSRWSGFASPIDQVADPSRSMHRPLTSGWVQTVVAQANLRSGDVAAALNAGRRATALLSAAGDTASLRRAQSVMAQVLAEMGVADSAAHYRALAQAGAPGPGSDVSIVPLRDVAWTRPFAEALRVVTAALQASRRDGSQMTEARALEALGYLYFRRRAPVDPATATAYYDSAATLLRAMALRGISDDLRVHFAEQFARLQQESTLAWLARAPRIGARAAAAAAVAAADRGRGQAFDLLAGTGFRSGAISDQILDVHNDSPMPEIGESLLNPRLRYGPGSPSLSYLHAQDTLIVWVRLPRSDTGTAELQVTRRAISADSLAAMVTRARVALGADSAAHRSLPVLEPAATRGVGVSAGVGPGSADEALRALARLLIPSGLPRTAISQPRALTWDASVGDEATGGPQYGAAGELLIVTHGPLAAVPFAALPFAGDTALGSRYSVRYAPSLISEDALYRSGTGHTSLPRTASRGAPDSAAAARREWLGRAVVIGNPAMPAVSLGDGAEAVRLSSLPGAEAEATAVAEMMGVQALTGEDATIAALKPRARSATVVHLATHGYAFATASKVGQSFVALAPGGGDNGLLTVTKLMAGTLELVSADLVVLSACQTALGQLTSSEGTLGLQRAFLAAGARSVLVSLWSVSDRATDLLLRSFYRHWLQDVDQPTKSEALRRAQEDVRRTPGFDHPRYWSAFQLVGAE